jgi:hypothetical protein
MKTFGKYISRREHIKQRRVPVSSVTEFRHTALSWVRTGRCYSKMHTGVPSRSAGPEPF